LKATRVNKMKILFSGENFYPAKSGAEYSVLTLFDKLKEDHELEAVCTGNKTETIIHNGIKIHRINTPFAYPPSWIKRYFLNKIWIKYLNILFKKKSYDLVITQTTVVPSTVEMAKKHKIPVLVFVRSQEHFCLSNLRDVKIMEKHNCLKHATWKYKIQYPFFKGIIKWHIKALKEADFLVANSKFIQNITKKWYGLNSVVIYPFFILDYYRVEKRSPEYITLIRPEIHKGVDIFIKIAKKMPKRKFLAVGNADRKYELMCAKNIEYIPWTNNMKKIYAKTKILLVPSIMPESFGRITVEAMCNGIPCIVSNIGALPEDVNAVGLTIKNMFDIDSWIEGIEKFDDDEFYKKMSKKVLKHAEKFDFKTQYKKFEKIVKKLSLVE